MKPIAFIFFVGVLFIGCRDNQPRAVDNSTLVYTPKNGIEAEPQLQKTDSLQLLFYDKPDGDSLRYSRFYSYSISKDSALIKTLLGDLNQAFEQRNDVKDCRSEGKIYLFGEEETLKTIYFSTRCDSCCYLYFIKDGTFLYFPLTQELNKLLNEEKLKGKTE